MGNAHELIPGNFYTCPSFPAGGASHRLVAMGLVAICSHRWQHDKHFKRIDGVDLPNCTQVQHAILPGAKIHYSRVAFGNFIPLTNARRS